MTTDQQHGERISRWLEAEAQTQLPEHVLRATFERTRRTRQQTGWQAVLGRLTMNRTFFALGGTAAAVAVVLFALATFYNPSGMGGPPIAPSPTSETASPIVEPTPALTPTAEPEGELFVSERHGYSILLPDDSWMVEEVPGEWPLGRVPSEAPQTPGMDKFEPVGRDDLRFSIISQPVPDGTSFAEWANDLDESLMRDFSNCQLTDEVEAGLVDGSAARITHLRCAGTVPPYWSSVLWFHGGRGYAMTFNLQSSLAEDATARRTAIDAWLARIDLTPATAAPPPDEATTEQAIEMSIGTWQWALAPGDASAQLWSAASAESSRKKSLLQEALASLSDDTFATWLTEIGHAETGVEHADWLGWHALTRIPWAQAGEVTVIAVGEEWNLVVHDGSGYQLVDAPWRETLLFAFDLAVGPDGFVAAGLTAEGMEERGSFMGERPAQLHRWGSADGFTWRELGSPLPIGQVEWSWWWLAGDGNRLLMGPWPDEDKTPDLLWSSTDGRDWEQLTMPVSFDTMRSPPSSTSYGWSIVTESLGSCETWVSRDGRDWVSVPAPTAGSHQCLAYGDEVYVLVGAALAGDPEDPAEPSPAELWIGQLSP